MPPSPPQAVASSGGLGRSIAAAESGRPVAGVGLRVGAYMVDLILLGVALFAVVIVIGFSRVPGTAMGPIFVMALGLYQIGLWCAFGRTIGMLLGGLRVEDASDGEKLSVSRAIVRWFPLNLPFLAGLTYLAILAWPVLLISAATHLQHRGLHDRLSNSVVVVPVRVVDGVEVPIRNGTWVWVFLGVVVGLLALFSFLGAD
jgi:uncharacterized RDD family membrane protein YckC